MLNHPGHGADFIFENGGSGTIAQSIECCARGGQIAVIGFLSPAKEMPDVASLVLGRPSTLSLAPEVLRSILTQRPLRRQRLHHPRH